MVSRDERLLESAAGTRATHARDDLLVPKMLEAGDDTDHEEARHEDEVKAREEYAAGGDRPENATRLECSRETLTRGRLHHGDDYAARQGAEG